MEFPGAVLSPPRGRTPKNKKRKRKKNKAAAAAIFAVGVGVPLDDCGGSSEGSDEPAGPAGDAEEDSSEAEGTLPLSPLSPVLKGDAEVDGGDKRNSGAGERGTSGISDSSIGMGDSYAADVDGSAEAMLEAAVEAPTGIYEDGQEGSPMPGTNESAGPIAGTEVVVLEAPEAAPACQRLIWVYCRKIVVAAGKGEMNLPGLCMKWGGGGG